MTTAHEDFLRFFSALDPDTKSAAYTPWKGDVLRQSPPRWMSRPFRFTGVGSVLKGGRWSVKELMPAVYASTDPDTLVAEVDYKGRFYGWKKADFLPQLRIGMHWELQKVVNLTLPSTLKALGVRKSELLKCGWKSEQDAGREPVTQAIARAAFERLAEGLIVHSARLRGGVNIVYFPSHRLEGTMIDILNPGDLPPDMHGLDT